MSTPPSGVSMALAAWPASRCTLYQSVAGAVPFSWPSTAARSEPVVMRLPERSWAVAWLSLPAPPSISDSAAAFSSALSVYWPVPSADRTSTR